MIFMPKVSLKKDLMPLSLLSTVRLLVPYDGVSFSVVLGCLGLYLDEW
jgi:hypothetical protein